MLFVINNNVLCLYRLTQFDIVQSYEIFSVIIFNNRMYPKRRLRYYSIPISHQYIPFRQKIFGYLFFTLFLCYHVHSHHHRRRISSNAPTVTHVGLSPGYYHAAWSG